MNFIIRISNLFEGIAIDDDPQKEFLIYIALDGLSRNPFVMNELIIGGVDTIA